MADFDSTESISTAFVDARRAGHVLDAFPGAYPTSMDDAYRIQDNAITLAASEVGGWKVAMEPCASVDRFFPIK
jgi:2-keto-4-pentenoate hydratase